MYLWNASAGRWRVSQLSHCANFLTDQQPLVLSREGTCTTILQHEAGSREDLAFRVGLPCSHAYPQSLSLVLSWHAKVLSHVDYFCGCRLEKNGRH